MADYSHVTHEFEPVFDENSRVLILGSIPSVKSREVGFYYGNKQNRFWRLIARLTNSEIPETTEEKTKLLLRNGIALWDVISECDIIGSGDSSIRNAKPVEIGRILDCCNIDEIFANGKTAAAYYRRFLEPATGRKIVALPSTSPANAACGFERLCEEWSVILG
jgi:hypoxanthine-DNA glycosylase